jgi:hypothetical protein
VENGTGDSTGDTYDYLLHFFALILFDAANIALNTNTTGHIQACLYEMR